MSITIDQSSRTAVIGSGSWATALMKIILDNESSPYWYMHSAETMEYVLRYGRNPRYLRDVCFDTEKLKLSDDINQVVSGSDIIILAVPSLYLKSALEPLTVSLKDKFVVSAIKGIVPGENITVAEYLNSKYELPFDRIGIITGPCHAEEVALGRLSYLTAVCKDRENAIQIGKKLETPYIKVSPSTDIYGAEYASVLKNIYAIAVGIASGLGYGDNFLAVLISNCGKEMSRFLRETYPYERDTFDSAYLGDLLVTSYSQFSRNRTFGVMIGKGYPVNTAKMEMSMVAEGYYASDCIKQINIRYGVEMPIAETIYDILHDNARPSAAIQTLTKKLI